MGKYTTGIHPDVFEEYKERYRKFCQKEQLTAVRCAELRYQAHELNQMADKISRLYTPDKEDKEIKIDIASKLYYKTYLYRREVDKLEDELNTLRNALKLRTLCELKDVKWRYE